MIAYLQPSRQKLPANRAFGYTPNPEATDRFVLSLPPRLRLFSSAAPDLVADDDDSDAFPYRAIAVCMGVPGQRLHARNQGNVGSCVGNATATAGDVTTACEIVYQKQPERWVAPMAADGMYSLGRDVSGNLGRGDGSYGGAAAKAMRFGTIHMVKYGDVDLTKYSAQRCRDWSARGVPAAVKEAARSHPCKTTTPATTCEELRAACRNYYGANVCSGQGFSSKRDADGFCKASGSWSHSMAVIAYRGGKRRGFLIWNSWGDNASSGPIWPIDMPHGSFWCDWDVMAKMLRGRDTFAYSNYDGFKRQKINWHEELVLRLAA